ncbi:unnamed protein product [Lota lota]
MLCVDTKKELLRRTTTTTTAAAGAAATTTTSPFCILAATASSVKGAGMRGVTNGTKARTSRAGRWGGAGDDDSVIQVLSPSLTNGSETAGPKCLLVFLGYDRVYITGRGNNSTIDHWCAMTRML